MSNINKRMAVISCLETDMEMPTKNVIEWVSKNHNYNVSERYVQLIRKRRKSIMELKKQEGNENMISKNESKINNGDVFNTSTSKKPLNGNYGYAPVKEQVGIVKDWQVEVINLANECNYTIQEIAKDLKLSNDKVRETLQEFSFLVIGDVLDEEKEKVHFNTENETVMVEEDSGITETESFAGFGLNDFNILDGNYVPANGNYVKQEEKFWEVEIDCVTACSKVEKEINVFIHKVARIKAINYMKWSGACEWLAYLIGEKKEDGYHIYDLHLPEQQASSSLVDKVETDKYNMLKIVGVIHSHHEMGAGDEDNPSFSGHDASFINGNHNISLLAGRNRETGGFKIVGIGRTKTPCGSLMKIKAKVKSWPGKLENESEIKKDFMSKITKRPVVVNNYHNFNCNRKIGYGKHNYDNQSKIGCTGSKNGVTGVTHNPGRKTYHFQGGGYPANQLNQRKEDD